MVYVTYATPQQSINGWGSLNSGVADMTDKHQSKEHIDNFLLIVSVINSEAFLFL